MRCRRDEQKSDARGWHYSSPFRLRFREAWAPTFPSASIPTWTVSSHTCSCSLASILTRPLAAATVLEALQAARPRDPEPCEQGSSRPTRLPGKLQGDQLRHRDHHLERRRPHDPQRHGLYTHCSQELAASPLLPALRPRLQDPQGRGLRWERQVQPHLARPRMPLAWFVANERQCDAHQHPRHHRPRSRRMSQTPLSP